MNPTEEPLSADDAQPSAVVDDNNNIPTDVETSPAPIKEEPKEPPADSSSSPEIRMSPDDAESKSTTEAPGSDESVVKTPSALSSDHEGISNETITENREEEFDGENNNNQAEGLIPSADEEDASPAEVSDTSCAQKDATTNNNEECEEEKEILEERTDNDAEGCVDDTFVSVELSSSALKNNSSFEETGGQQEEQIPLMDAAQKINPSLEVVPTDAAMASSVSSNDNVAAASKLSSLNISQPPTTTTTTTTTRRRKILHHPILSHLTKLPWDRLTNAGSACDVIFNCKYSMKQVEDEVREECRRGVSGEGVYIEDYVGRGEDGYVNVSLNECSDYQYQEEGCEAGEFEQILGCCSMLDNEEDSEDEEEDDVECVVPENSIASQKEPHLVQPMKMKGLEGSHPTTVDTNQKEGEEEREYSGDNNRVKSNNNELLQQQQSDQSWQQANPSLEMMMYRQFLNE